MGSGEGQGKSGGDGWNAGEETRCVSLSPFLLVLPDRHNHPSRCSQEICSLSDSGDNQQSMYRSRKMNKDLMSTAPNPVSTLFGLCVHLLHAEFLLTHGCVKEQCFQQLVHHYPQFRGFMAKAESVPYLKGLEGYCPWERDQGRQSSA